jgi:hypothetical protein
MNRRTRLIAFMETPAMDNHLFHGGASSNRFVFTMFGDHSKALTRIQPTGAARECGSLDVA